VGEAERGVIGETEIEAVTEAWVELRVPDLGVRARIPPFLHPLPFHEGERHGLFLSSGRGDWRQALALTRLPGCAAGAWEAEARRLAETQGWLAAVAAGPEAAEIDGACGEEGWLRFRDPLGQDLVGLLWVGEVAGDRVTVAYWCEAWQEAGQSHWFMARYRCILASIRWTPQPPETP
jgi:hypothetical protein